MKVASIIISLLLSVSTYAITPAPEWLARLAPLNDAFLINTPDDNHGAILKVLTDAKSQIQMSIFHLTDPQIIDVLIAKKAQGVKVQVILDNASLASAHYADTFKRLKAGHVDVIASSPQFNITHSKIFIVDNNTAFISTMNFVEHFQMMRDFGVFTREPSVVKELQTVFQADLQNAKSNTMITPRLQSANLVWSPVNSETKIVELIASSQRSLEVTSENLGNAKVTEALIDARKRGVIVRVLTPACDLAKDPWRNYPFLRLLAKAGVQIKVMPSPSTPKTPYMHAKTIIVDRAMLFLGSENLSNNSLLYSREVGIVFTNKKSIGFVGSSFERDWIVSMPLQATNPTCPPLTFH
jgi:cardiolipin synthase